MALVFFAALGAALWRAWDLQVARGAEFRDMAERQVLRTVEMPPWRGALRARNGDPIAISVEVASIAAHPRQIERARRPGVAAALARMLDLPAAELRERLSGDGHFVWIQRRVSVREAARVRAADIDGVSILDEPRRVYPHRELAAQLVGFTNIDSAGIEGLELALDGLLRGRAHRAPGLRDALGQRLFPEGLPPPRDLLGHEVVLTLDLPIQHAADRAVVEAQKRWRARSAFALVIDPRTGEVLALANAPSFNPNRPADAPAAARRNRAVTDAFEPGSVIKAFTVAAALDAGAIGPEERLFCENGAWRIGGHVIHDTHPYQWLDVAGIVQKSSNIGAGKIGRRLGRDALHAFLARLGFGRATGIDVPGERSGVLRPPDGWSEVGLANVAFGQGMTATGLQIAAALAAVANGGHLVRPHVVREVRDAAGRVVRRPRVERTRVMSARTAATVAAMLARATEEGGTGTKAAIPGVAVAGKTGTAQKVDPVSGGYARDRFTAAFAGFAPAGDARVLAVVVVDEPQGEHYGGLVAAPAFREIADAALRHLGVPRDRAAAPGIARAEGDAARAAAGGRAGLPRPSASDAETAVPPSVPIAAAEDDAPPDPGDGRTLVPDFTGMSLGEAIDAARRARVSPVIEGSGRAAAQSPGPGPAAPGAEVRIRFSPG